MFDRSTKIILLAIAAGLWANALVQMTRPAIADNRAMTDVKDHLSTIAAHTYGADKTLHDIYKGECPNKKLC